VDSDHPAAVVALNSLTWSKGLCIAVHDQSQQAGKGSTLRPTPYQTV
jgi:hypothetical protein